VPGMLVKLDLPLKICLIFETLLRPMLELVDMVANALAEHSIDKLLSIYYRMCSLLIFLILESDSFL